MSHTFTYAELSALPKDILISLLHVIGSTTPSLSDGQLIDQWSIRVLEWVGDRELMSVYDIPEWIDIGRSVLPDDEHRLLRYHAATWYLLYADTPDVMPFTVYRALDSETAADHLLRRQHLVGDVAAPTYADYMRILWYRKRVIAVRNGEPSVGLPNGDEEVEAEAAAMAAREARGQMVADLFVPHATVRRGSA